MQRFRNVCFTINNYTDADLQRLEAFKGQCKYLIYGLEGKGKTPHIQGYGVLQEQLRFNKIKELLGRAHIEARKGTHEQALTYCKKEGDFKEHGQINPGARTDLDRVREDCKEEAPMRNITSYGNMQQINVAKQYLTYNEEPRNWKPNVTWICGPSGSGKSKQAREMTTNAYVKNDSNKWWDGYDAHTDVIIDDFRGSWWELTEMLSLLDRYEKRVEIKGGYRQFKPKNIVITAIRSPEEEYTFGKKEPSEQLLRRIDNIIRLKGGSDSEVSVSEVAGNTFTAPSRNPMSM